MRPALVLAGLTLLYAASLFLIAKPPSHLSFLIPAVSVSHNVLFFLYLRVVQWVFGLSPGVLMAANAVLMGLTLAGVFRAGWGWADARYRLSGATLALALVAIHPLAIVLPLTLGYLGGYLWAPLFLMVFVNTMIAVENWSAFMRSIVLAVAWSLFLWVHLPTALCVLVAMIPWVLYNRRPMTAMGIFLTVLILGAVMFSGSWTLGCVVARRWSMIKGPVDTVCALGGYVVQGVTTAWSGGSASFNERSLRIIGWLSPFLFIQGLWVTGLRLFQMLKERRASPVDLTALIALCILAAALTMPGKDVLPGAWYLVMVVVLWAPLIARRLAQKENFYSRGFRLTFSAGFVVCGIAFLIIQGGPSGGFLVPEGATLLKLVAVMAVAGGVLHAVLKKHPLTLENRMQALLTGSTLAYFLVMDGLLFR